MALNLALNITGWLCVFATAVPLIRKERWWIRIFDFPRIQILIFTSLITLVILITRFTFTIPDLALFALLLVSIGYQTKMILPYSRLSAKEVATSQTIDPLHQIDLLVTNIYMGNQQSRRYLKIAREVQADIHLVLEADAWWADQLRPLEEQYPHRVKIPQDNTYGMLLYSRFPLIDPQVKYLVDERVPSIHTLVRLPSGRIIKLHCVHPRPPRPLRNQHTTDRDAELLIVAKSIRNTTMPVIVAGDYNDVGWSTTTTLFQRISGLLDPRVGRGMYSTFHARYPVYRFPLDHIFHSVHFTLGEFKRLRSVGSDHFPLYCRLVLEPSYGKTESVMDTFEEYLSEARDIIDKVEQLDELATSVN